MKKKHRGLIVVLIIVIIVLALVLVMLGLDHFRVIDLPSPAQIKEAIINPQEEENETFQTLDGKFTDTKITDEKTAIKAAQEAAIKLHINGAADELKAESIDTVDGITYYRLQQLNGKTPIYGRAFVVMADSDGNAVGINTNCDAIKATSIYLDGYASLEEVSRSIKEKMIELTGDSNVEYTIVQEQSEWEDTICIYPDEGTSGGEYAYTLDIASEYGYYTFFVSQGSAKILHVKEASGYQKKFRADGQKEVHEFTAEGDMSGNRMISEMVDGTKLSVYTPDSDHKFDWYTSDSKRHIVAWNNGDKPDKSAVDVLANTTAIYNYYLNTFKRSSFDGDGVDIDLYVHTTGLKQSDSNDDFVNNAFFWNPLGQPFIAVTRRYSDSRNTIETDDYGCELDVIGHEYTHGVVSYTSGLEDTESNHVPSAINEAVADIMGYCAESSITGQRIDWKSSVRDSNKDTNKKPEQLYNAKDYVEGTEKTATDEHYASTIVSYAAYLMNTANRGTIGDRETAKLWYHTILMLPSDCTFEQLRSTVETAAENLNFTQDKKHTIASAFDEVGIKDKDDKYELREYNKDFKVKVFDDDGEAYGDYQINIDGIYNSGLWGLSWFGAFTEKYSKSFDSDDSGVSDLSLPDNGKYVLTLSDRNGSGEIYEKRFRTRKDADDKEMIFNTDYTTPSKGDDGGNGTQTGSSQRLSDERDIVLVLDHSGSMAGTPLDETKKASVKFVQTILGESANIGVVAYDETAYRVTDFSTDEQSLTDGINDIYEGGSTNISGGLEEADNMLSASHARKKIIVLMSDGLPNDGLQGDDLINYASDLKDKGYIVYTLGFFEYLTDEKPDAQALMEGIASDGCHYEVDSADNLVFFFNDVADQINGQKYIYIRIACPVDVTVSYDGETLDADNLRTDFGTLTFEENENDSESDEEVDEDDLVKVLRLKEGADYDVSIDGTGNGRMDYTIGFMDDNGDYSDMRKFNNIRINRRTQIDTVAKVADTSELKIDEDGDGKYELRLRAGRNGRGEEVKTPLVFYLMIVAALLLVAFVFILVIYVKITKRKAAKNG